ncbi:non-homologous end-joining DNA ligase [Actinomycetospora sp. CA-084318]|uniref:non-homologous end-joining DNA ligase n=1 Tax=Actinomycetospora sp. CA-084318 TaxID=3239892 RepID=UPI003D957950
MVDLANLPPEQVRALKRAPDAGFRAPMLASLSKPTDPPLPRAGWSFERKLDGVRVIATRERGERPRLWSRNQKPADASYPEVVDALDAAGPDRFVLDGEIIAADGRFGSLQARMHLSDPRRARATGVAIECHLFDLLVLDDLDVTRLPLITRRALLETVVRPEPPVVVISEELDGDPLQLRDAACADGWEGLIAKRLDAPYATGRSHDWRKLKCVRDQEFVIGGWTDPAGSRSVLGALLVGYHEDGVLRYAGKVGTGFDDAALQLLRSRLDPLASDVDPFSDAPRERGRHWVRPVLVCQVGFGEWTSDGRLRHPRYQGLREDKAAAEVVRESM